MKRTPALLSLILFLALHCQPVYADEVVIWTGDPITLQLQVGATRRVQLLQADSVSVGLPQKLYEAEALEVEVLGNTIWLTAHASMPPSRFVIESRPTGEHLVFEIHTTQRAVDAVLKVEDAPPPAKVTGTPADLGFIALTRWAVRSVYAAERLQSPLTGLSRYPVIEEELDLFRCGPNSPPICGGAVQARLTAAYRTTQFYLSIVALSNQLDQTVILDPREIRGHWRTATFVHTRLTPRHDPESHTTLVLISDLPPEQAVEK